MPNQLVRSPIFYIYKVTFESGATYRSTQSNEYLQKRRDAKICKHWYTDGVHNTFCKECPEGYFLGFTKNKKTIN